MKKSEITVTMANGTTRPATKEESTGFQRFCDYMDRTAEAMKKNTKLDWDWEHTGGGINVATLPVEIKVEPEHTGNVEVEISLGDESVGFHPYRLMAEKGSEGEIILPDGDRMDIADLWGCEWSDLGQWDKRFEGLDVYTDGWQKRVRAWCKKHILTPDPKKVAVDIIRIIETDSLRGGRR